MTMVPDDMVAVPVSPRGAVGQCVGRGEGQACQTG